MVLFCIARLAILVHTLGLFLVEPIDVSWSSSAASFMVAANSSSLLFMSPADNKHPCFSFRDPQSFRNRSSGGKSYPWIHNASNVLTERPLNAQWHIHNGMCCCFRQTFSVLARPVYTCTVTWILRLMLLQWRRTPMVSAPEVESFLIKAHHFKY